MKKIILSVAAFAMLAFNAFSQAPEAVKYQAVVRDGSSLIVANQSVGVQLRILEGSASGTAVYTETFNVTTNQYGLINLEIGTGTTIDDFSTIDWGNGSYFIENAIDVSGGTTYQVMGASQLLSVPYALYANTADNVINDQVDDADNDPTNELQDWSTLPGIPADIADGDDVDDADADPNNEIQDLELNGNTLSLTNDATTVDLSSYLDNTDAQTLSLAGSDLSISGGNSVTLPSGADTDWTINGTDQYSGVTGNVGIGTTTPTEKLEVVGVIRVSESPNDEMVINNDDEWNHGSGLQDFGDGGDHFMVASREQSFESAGIYGDGDHITIWSPGDGAPGQPAALLYVNDEDSYDGTDSDPFNNNALRAYLNTAGNWVAASDKNRKENINEVTNALDNLMKINGYTYNFKLAPAEIKKGDQKVTTYGVIAQEVIEYFPEIVDVADDGSHYVSYTELIPILIEATQEQQKLILDLQKENEVLKSRLDAMDARLKAAGF